MPKGLFHGSKQKPRRTLARTLELRQQFEVAMGITLALGIAAIVGFFVQGGFIDRAFDQIPHDTDPGSRLEALAHARRSLIDLDAVLADQRKTMEERQQALRELKTEHEALNKVLAADRNAVEAIFDRQRLKSQEDAWKERGVGFLLGVLSGLLTALILHRIALWRKRTS
jgi:uncharacterized coiled-coil protein SlyX